MGSSSQHVRSAGRKVPESFFPNQPAATQLTLNFDLSLLDQFDTLDDVIRHVAQTCGVPKKNIARDMDWSPSQLSRFLSDNDSDPGHAFPAKKLSQFIDVTGSSLPVQWLALKHMSNPATHQARALETIAQLAPVLQRAMAALTGVTT